MRLTEVVAGTELPRIVYDTCGMALQDATRSDVDIVAPPGLSIRLTEQPGPEAPSASALTGVDTLAVDAVDVAGAVPTTREDWNVPDDPTSLTGRFPWVRVAGTSLVVQGYQARSLPGVSDLQVGRCGLDLGTIDQVISVEVPGFVRKDAALVTAAVTARMLNDGSLTFYQARAVLWAGGNFFDLWRAVANVWTRIAGPVNLTPQPGLRLELRVTGTPTPTLVMSVDGVPISGPLDDPGGLIAGQFGGITTQIDGGTQADVALDNWQFDSASPTLAVLGADLIGSRLSEGALRDKVLWLVDSMPVNLFALPQDTWVGRNGPEGLPVGLGEAAAVGRVTAEAGEALVAGVIEIEATSIIAQHLSGLDELSSALTETIWLSTAGRGVVDTVPVPMTDVLGAPNIDLAVDVPSGDSLAPGVGESGVVLEVGLVRAGEDLVALDLLDIGAVGDVSSLSGADTLGVGLGEGGSRADVSVTVPTIRVVQESTRGAGLIDEAIIWAGLADEAAAGLAGVSGETATGVEES